MCVVNQRQQRRIYLERVSMKKKETNGSKKKNGTKCFLKIQKHPMRKT